MVENAPISVPNRCGFLRTPATPESIKDWSLTNLKEKLIKIGAKVVRHGHYYLPDGRGRHPTAKCSRGFCGSLQNCGRSHHRSSVRRRCSCIQAQPAGGVRPHASKMARSAPSAAVWARR
jgi:hypothetical protein